MPAGVGVGRLWALVREARSLEQRARPIAVRGTGAVDVAGRLAAGGDQSAVRAGGDPAGAAALVVVLARAAVEEEQLAMRVAARAGIPIVVVRVGGFDGPVPYALPSDVIDVAGDDVRLDPLVELLATALDGDDAVALAGQLPALREAVERRLIERTSRANAAIAAAPWIKEAHLPLMSLAQGQMLLRLGVANGKALPRDPQQLAVVAGPRLGGALAVGIGLRALHRHVPGPGPLVGALIAYAGTRALGAAGARLPS